MPVSWGIVWSVGGATEHRQLSWDLIRVIAITEVVLFHLTFLAPATERAVPAAPFQWLHPFGASVLLVVSGYFAADAIRKYQPGWWFRRRLARLLPAYVTAVVVIFALARLFAPADLGLSRLTYGDLIGNLLLVQQLLPNVAFVDLAYWTLPVQVGGFAAIALLARYRVLRGRGCVVVLWTVLAAPLLVRWIWMGNNPAMWQIIAIEGTGLSRAHLLVAGVTIWLWAQRRIGTVHLLALLGAVLVAQKAHPPIDNSIPLLAAMLAFICLAARVPNWRVPGLATPIRWLAGCSFGIYLAHQSIGQLIAVWMARHGANPWLWLTTAITSAVLLGWLLTRYIERPAYRYLTRRRPATLTQPEPIPASA